MEDKNNSAPALVDLSEAQRRPAMTRFAVLRPYLEGDAPLARTARDADVPIRTVERWLTRYRRDGLAGLTRRVRDDAGTHRGKKQLIGTTELDVAITNQCGRLIANVIIAYNSILLSALLERYKAADAQKAITLLGKISPVAWQHIQFPRTLPVPWQPPSNRCRGAPRRRGSLAL